MTGRDGGGRSRADRQLACRRPGAAAARRQHRRLRARHGEWRAVPPAPGRAARRLAAGEGLAQFVGRRSHPGCGDGVRVGCRCGRRPAPRVRHLPAAAPHRQAGADRARRGGRAARDLRAAICAPACCSARSAPASTMTTWRRPMRWCAIRSIPAFMSLNLAQAVMVLAYEWWTAAERDAAARR